MKNITKLTLTLMLCLSGGLPAMAHDHDMAGMHETKSNEVAAVGVVEGVDASTGAVTITHEPIKSLNWPGMTMDFVAKDKALLKKLAKGKKIDFSFVDENGEYVITKVK